MERRPYSADQDLEFTLPRRLDYQLLCEAVLFDKVDGVGANPEAENQFTSQSKSNISAYGNLQQTRWQLAKALYAGRRRMKTDSNALLNFPLPP